MVSAVVAVPVVKSLDATDAVQVGASSARLSVTVTPPSRPVMFVPVLPEPMLAVAGTLISSSPTLTANVRVVSQPGRPVVALRPVLTHVVTFGPVGTGIEAGAAGPPLAGGDGVWAGAAGLTGRAGTGVGVMTGAPGKRGAAGAPGIVTGAPGTRGTAGIAAGVLGVMTGAPGKRGAAGIPGIVTGAPGTGGAAGIAAGAPGAGAGGVETGAAGPAEAPAATAPGDMDAPAIVVPARPAAAMVSAAVTANLPPVVVKNAVFRMSRSPPRNGREHRAPAGRTFRRTPGQCLAAHPPSWAAFSVRPSHVSYARLCTIRNRLSVNTALRESQP